MVMDKYVCMSKLLNLIDESLQLEQRSLRSIIMLNQYAFCTVLMKHIEHNFRTKQHWFRARWRLMVYLKYLQTYIINAVRFEIVSKWRIPQTPSSCK